MKVFDFKNSYQRYARKLERDNSPGLVVPGAAGDFEAMGRILIDLLRSCGLEREHSFVELQVSDGRLTVQLSGFLEGPYLGLGTDPHLLEQARRLAARPEWRFELAQDLKIPAEDQSVDMVSLFGVVSEHTHEQSYLYFEELSRILKPGGRAVLSFLEFEIPPHWTVFEGMVARQRAEKTRVHSNQFVSRDALYAWAAGAGLIVLDIWRGDKPFIPLSKPVRMSDGRVFESEGTPGQSVCALQKPYED